MIVAPGQTLPLEALRHAFGSRLHEQARLQRYTAARVGGPAEALVEAGSRAELSTAVSQLWELGVPFLILGGGSNVLISDQGVRGVVVLNRARAIQFEETVEPPSVWAESGANLGLIARQAAARGLPGLEWAAGIPGSLGGAVVGNAGAHDGDMAGNLLVAEILHQEQESGQVLRQMWPVERLEYAYRTSLLKHQAGNDVVLAATLRLGQPTAPQAVQAGIEAFTERRRRTQPPGASMGSMFKNPPGDYAGRLIEAAGLKGTRIGGAEISPLHGNFFINHGQASAADIYQLIHMAQAKVAEMFGVQLELEVELIGDWTQ